MNLRPKIETFLVIACVGIIVWSARLIMIGTIGHVWFGTLGVTSVLMGMIIFLSWKGKLGKFGQIYKNVLTHKLTKKLTKIGLVWSVFTIFMFSIFSAGVHASQTVYVAETDSLIDSIDPALLDENEVAQAIYRDMSESPQNTILGVLVSFVAVPLWAFTDFAGFSAMMGAVNTMLDGHLIHFVDIMLVGEIELFGILAYLGMMQRKAKTITTN